MVTIENKTKKVNYKPTLGELIEHDNGKVGMITHVTFNDEVKVCVFQELYINHTDTEARWAIKNVKPFTGKITIQNT
jgi:hypothetical protein